MHGRMGSSRTVAVTIAFCLYCNFMFAMQSKNKVQHNDVNVIHWLARNISILNESASRWYIDYIFFNVSEKRKTIVKKLLYKKNACGRTPMHRIAYYSSSSSSYSYFLKKVLDFFSDFNELKDYVLIKDNFGKTAISYAVVQKNLSFFCGIACAGFDIYITELSNDDEFNSFISRLSEYSKRSRSCDRKLGIIHIAASKDDVEILSYLLGYSDVNMSDMNGLTPLDYAFAANQYHAINFLFENGGRRNFKNMSFLSNIESY